MIKVKARDQVISKTRRKFRGKNPNLIREGEANRNAFYELILQHPEGLYPREIDMLIVQHPEGLYLNEVHNTLGLNTKPSKQTRTVHLSKLMEEGRIFKKDAKYFPSDPDLSFIIDFGKTMRQASGIVLSPHLLVQRLKDPTEAQLPIYPDWQVFSGYSSDKLHSSAENPTLSPTLKLDYRNIDSLQKEYLFQFAVRIGAFVTYIFLQSIRPQAYNLKFTTESQKIKRRKEMLKNLLKYSIDLESIFQVFEEYLKILNLRSGISHVDLEMAFQELFPSFYKALEIFYQDEIFDHTNNLEMLERYSNHKFYCPHKWEEFHIFKIDTKYYFCSKCQQMVDEYRKNESDERNMKKL